MGSGVAPHHQTHDIPLHRKSHVKQDKYYKQPPIQMARFADKLKKKICKFRSWFDLVIVHKELLISTMPNAVCISSVLLNA